MAAGPPLKCGRLHIPFVNGDCRNSHVRDDSLETDDIAADHKTSPEEEDIAGAGFIWYLSLRRRERGIQLPIKGAVNALQQVDGQHIITGIGIDENFINARSQRLTLYLVGDVQFCQLGNCLAA